MVNIMVGTFSIKTKQNRKKNKQNIFSQTGNNNIESKEFSKIHLFSQDKGYDIV